MVTTLPRYSITETPEIARAVDCGVALWPEASRSEVMRHLIVLGGESAKHDLARRAAIVQDLAGFLPNVYPAGAASDLKNEWPA